MAFSDILKEMIVDSSVIALDANYQKWKVKLVEPQCEDSVVEIIGMPEGTIVIKADDFPVPVGFFNGHKSELKRADYIIVTQYKDDFYTLIIEMKRGKKDESHIISQLRGGLCLYRYLQEIGKTFWEDTEFLKPNKLRFISLSKTSISKRTSRPKAMSFAECYHDTPEKMLKVTNSTTLRFENLISKPC